MPSQIETAAKLYETGDLRAADSICCQIIKNDMCNATALHLRGVIAYQSKNYMSAVEQLSKANKLLKNNRDIMFALAASYEYTQQYNAAIRLYRKICELEPENPIARKQLAGVLKRNHKLADALDEYHIILNSGNADPSVLFSLSQIYAKSGTFDKALLYLEKLGELKLEDPDIWNNMGLIYKAIERYDDSINCYNRALSFDYDHKASKFNLASALQDAGRYNEAKVIYINILENTNEDSEQLSRIHYNLALIYLGSNDFINGWNHLSLRPKIFPYIPTLDEIKSSNLLVVGEEGLGDELMFLRFIPLLKNHANSIDYVGNNKLTSLIKQIEGIDNFFDQIPTSNHYDYCLSIMDVPTILEVGCVENIIPVKLNANKDLDHPIFNSISINRNQPILGINWEAGIEKNKNTEKYLEKSIPIEVFTSMLKNFSGTIVILQRNPDKNDIQYLTEHLSSSIIDASSLNEDLDLMLSLLSKVDHYVGVSNTNMHLFGSLGKRCDVIIPFPGEWRWMYKNNSSPWYPNFNLLRQQSDLKWDYIKHNLLSYLTINKP